ncbi:MAG: Hpt domain-containing protein [Bacteroidia bacterium]
MDSAALTLNLTHLRSITGDDNGFVIEILQMIQEQSPEVISNMEVFLEKGDYKALGAVAHKYKSSINVLGNPVLSGMVKEIEQIAIENPDKGQLPDLVHTFRETCDNLLEVIKAELNLLR